MSVGGSPGDLWRAYLATTFCATVNGEAIRIRCGEVVPALDSALGSRHVTTWAFITAWNPGSSILPASANVARQQELVDDLRRRGFELAEGRGEPVDASWEPEASLLIFGIGEAEAVTLGTAYGQSAIVAGRKGEAARLVPCPPELLSHVHSD